MTLLDDEDELLIELLELTLEPVLDDTLEELLELTLEPVLLEEDVEDELEEEDEGADAGSKLCVFSLPLTPIIKLSTYPTKLFHAGAPNPATTRTPPEPLGLFAFTMRAFGCATR